MAYQQLMTARNDFSNFGGSLASIQENAVDVASSNQQTNTFYQSLSTQLESTGLMEGIPSIPAVVGAGYGVYKAVRSLGSLKGTVIKGAEDAMKLTQSGVTDLKNVGQKFVSQAQQGLDDTKNVIKTAVETVQTEGEGLLSNVKSAGAGVLETVQTEGEGVLNAGRSALESTIGSAESTGSDLINSVRTGVESTTSTISDEGRLALLNFNPSEALPSLPSISSLTTEPPVRIPSIFTDSERMNLSADEAFNRLTPSGREPPPPPSEQDRIQNTPEAVPESVAPSAEPSLGEGIGQARSSFRSAGEALLPSGETTAQLASGGAELGEDANSILHTYSGFTEALKPQMSIGSRISNFFGMGERQPLTMTSFNAPSVSASVPELSATVAPEASAVVENITSGIQNVAQTGGRAVSTTLASTEQATANITAKVGGAVENVGAKLGGATETVLGAGENVASTITGTASTLASTVGEGVETASKLAVGLSDIALPVIGEIGLAGLGIYTAIKGFEDLFSHPKAPTVAPVPVVANISQSFQSGI